MQNGIRIAAVDLGSNSFRLEIGQHEHGQIRPSEYLKEPVRLGGGLDAQRNLTLVAMQRGWDCLARFGERLAGFKKTQVRAVATQTLREARNRDAFLTRANEVLGFPIEVISGQEEARLIYQGVAHGLPQSDERRLVMDIGGRSTELILGHGYTADQMESYRVGSVAWSMKYFPDGQFSEEAFELAEVAAKAVLDEALGIFPRNGWDIAYGSAGTIGAVADILHAAGHPAQRVTRDGLLWLVDKLIKAQSSDRVRLDGLKDDRRPVIGGGVSVLKAVFDLFEIEELHAAGGALRHGVLYEMLNREQGDTDTRSATVHRLAAKFSVDIAQAQRVVRIAGTLLGELQPRDGDSEERENAARVLAWAAELHEIGTGISHSDHHKHGAYILDHADAPGFAQSELHRLSLLVLGHRGKLKKLEEADFSDAEFVRQLLALRLAVLLCHARRDPDMSGLRLQELDNTFTLTCRTGWALDYPQSAHLLREEVSAWAKVGWQLELALG